MRTCLLALLLLCSPAYAAVVTITLSVDESFELYLNGDPRSNQGLIGSGSGEGNVFTFSGTVTPQTRYLVVVAHDHDTDSQQGGILAHATLSNALYRFTDNRKQEAVTGDTWFTLGGSFAGGISPNEPGNPRGQKAGIPENAYWIWGDPGPREAIVWVRISPTPIPEPGTLLFAAPMLLVLHRFRSSSRRRF